MPAKALKAFSLAVATMMVLMAFGSSTAVATTLFTNSAKTVTYASGTEFKAELVSGTSTALTSGEGNTIATCTSSGVAGKTSNSSGATVTGNLSSLTWGGCSQTTHTVANGTLHIAYTSGNDGTVTGSGNSVQLMLFGVTCTYGTGKGTHLGSITGGTAPVLKIKAAVPTVVPSSWLCPSFAVWDAEYVLMSPHALFVGA